MLPLTGPAWKLLHQLTGVRAADHPTAPVEALRNGAGKVVYGKEAVQAFADHLAQVYEGGHQVPEDLIANIPYIYIYSYVVQQYIYIYIFVGSAAA